MNLMGSFSSSDNSPDLIFPEPDLFYILLVDKSRQHLGQKVTFQCKILQRSGMTTHI